MERTAVIPVHASGLVESAVTCPIYHPPFACMETIYQMKHKWAASILSLFPRGIIGWIRTFLAYYDSRHSLKEGLGVQVCVFLDLHGLFRLSPDDPLGHQGDAP